MRVRVEITRRPEIADPEGSTIRRALRDLGHQVSEARVDRVINLEVDGNDRAEVESAVELMCREVLANPVLEDFTIEVGS